MLKIQHLDWLLRTAKVQLKKLGAANWNMFGIGADPEFLLSTDRKSAPAEQFNVTVKASVLSLSNGLVFLHSNNKPKALSSAMPTKRDISVKRPQSATVTIVRVVEASDQRNRKIPRTAKPGDVQDVLDKIWKKHATDELIVIAHEMGHARTAQHTENHPEDLMKAVLTTVGFSANCKVRRETWDVVNKD